MRPRYPSKSFLLACIVLVLSLMSRGALAAIVAVSFTDGFTDSFADDTAGFRFSVGVTNVSVSALGFYDLGGDGLADSHDVGIFDVATRQLLVSASIPSGTKAVLDGGFRYVDVSPTILLANRSYVINGYRPTAADAILDDVSNLTTAAFITYDGEVAANFTGGLVFIDTPFGAINGWFGPNFKADVVPEPNAALLLVAASGIFHLRCRRRCD